MYQNIDFSQTGGFPLTQDAMAFLQNAYNQVLSSLTGLIGTYGIITGTTDLGGGMYSDGWVSYNGEIVPFVGGPISAGPYVGITETVVSVTYRDSGLQGVIKTRKAEFTTDSSKPNISVFTRITLPQLSTDTNTALTNANTALTNANTALTNANTALSTANSALAAATSSIPSGVILLWNSTVGTIPSGWVVCDGTNGTPDLRGRVVIGTDGAFANYPIGDPNGVVYSVNATGGLTKQTLTVANLPPHVHNILGQSGGDDSNNNNYQRFAGGDKGLTESGFFFTNTFACQSTGTGTPGNMTSTPFDNRQAFRALCYIMKT